MKNLDPLPFIYPNSISFIDGKPVRSMFTHGNGEPLTWAPRDEYEQDRTKYTFTGA